MRRIYEETRLLVRGSMAMGALWAVVIAAYFARALPLRAVHWLTLVCGEMVLIVGTTRILTSLPYVTFAPRCRARRHLPHMATFQSFLQRSALSNLKLET